ncbi:hypothetical protein HMPREF9630_00237 [Peptoanaerobacter stomatis]|uniref:Uncharacterized protein n=1 Tax=Peptoanaerobacter stomatis TaxID=796937 RepID=V9HSK1_9FIRM|nr:hypothetical protein [Peptoanaerobacter stomatis]EHL18512.1 hypothetical protein HMPREF9630_00237 [Peptoanaerobacter stomatis]
MDEVNILQIRIDRNTLETKSKKIVNTRKLTEEEQYKKSYMINNLLGKFIEQTIDKEIEETLQRLRS